MYLYIAFIAALAKYALGYGNRFLSYVRAALEMASKPSPSKSST